MHFSDYIYELYDLASYRPYFLCVHRRYDILMIVSKRFQHSELQLMAIFL